MKTPWPFVTADEGAHDAGLSLKAFYSWADRHSIAKMRIRVGRSTRVIYDATRLHAVLDHRGGTPRLQSAQSDLCLDVRTGRNPTRVPGLSSSVIPPE